MADKSWKAFERRLAKRVGGRRIPVTGERDGADVVAGPFVYQAKLRKGVPEYLREWLRSIVAAGERTGCHWLETPGGSVGNAPRRGPHERPRGGIRPSPVSGLAAATGAESGV